MDAGKEFTLSKFMIFLFRVAVVYFNNSQEEPMKTNTVKKTLFFMRKLENSEGLIRFMTKMHRNFTESLSFLPSKDILSQILQVERPHDDVPTSKEAMLAQILENKSMQQLLNASHSRSQIKDEPIELNLGPNDELQELVDEFMQKNEEKLKKVFEVYCAFGEPMNTKWLKSVKLLKMLKEAGMMKERTMGVKKGMKPLSLVEMDLIIAQLSYVATQNTDKQFNPGQSTMSVAGNTSHAFELFQ